MGPGSVTFCSCASRKCTQILDCNVDLLLEAHFDAHCHLGLVFV